MVVLVRVASNWVLEEATVANNGEKLLLPGWSGDINNPKWRLLVRGAREIVCAPPGHGDRS